MQQTKIARGRVLVVDDEPGLRDLLAWELSQEGYEVETAHDGVMAMNLARRHRFDLAITDLKMPGMDGAETVSALRAMDPEIEVIVATGYASVETAVSCMKRGAFDYIQKPYELDELRLLLERAMQKSHLQGLVELYEASRSLLLVLRRGELEPLVLDLAQKLLHAETVCLAVTEGRPSTSQAGARSASAQLVADLVAHAGSPSPVVLASDPRLPRLSEEGFSAALVIPLSVRATTLGYIAVLSVGGTFSLGDLRRTSVFGAQVALALHNARLSEALGERVQDLLRTRENLAVAERLHTGGRLATGLAHDLGGPLAHARALLEGTADDLAEMRALVTVAREAATHLREEGALPGIALARRLEDATQSRAGLPDRAADIEQTLDGIGRNVGRMARLVSRFQRMSRSTSTTERVAISPELALRTSLQDLQAESAHADVRFAISLECEHAAIVDRDDLEAALAYVLQFVCSRQPLATPLSTRVAARDGRVEIAITHPTLALRSDERQALLEARMEARQRGDEGLLLARRLLLRNAGDLRLERDGGGLCIRILLERATEAIEQAG